MSKDTKQILAWFIVLVAVTVGFCFLVMNDYIDKLVAQNMELQVAFGEVNELRDDFKQYLAEVR